MRSVRAAIRHDAVAGPVREPRRVALRRLQRAAIVTALRGRLPHLLAVDRLVVGAAGAVGGLLVLVEAVILLAGVIWRYGLDDPLVWVDELAEILFLWLVSFGAVVALHRGEHMKMTFFVNRMSPQLRQELAAAAALLQILFIIALLVPGYAFMKLQAPVTTPTLHIPGSWTIGGELAAFVLMLVTALHQLLRSSSGKRLALLLAATAAVAVILWQSAPFLTAIGNINLVVFFIGLAGLSIVCGVPIAFSFGISTVAYMLCTTDIPLTIVLNQMNQGMSAIELLAVPMFVLLGLLMEMTGIARALVDCLTAFVGHRRGGLSYALIGGMFVVSGISGSKAADQAAVAPVLLPEMKRQGVNAGEMVAQLAASAAMCETIPPSLVLIIVGAVTGVSTSALFSGGLLPAVIATAAIVALIFLRTRGDAAVGRSVPWRERARVLLVAIPALALPVLIRYAVLAGVATATEVATIGVVYSVAVGVLIYRRFAWRRLFPILVETAALSGAILLIVGTASAMSWALTQAGFAQTIADLMTAVPGGRAGFMAMSILVFIVLGSVLEGLPAMVLFGPLLFPIAQQAGINVVQYAIVAILAMGIGLFSPPFGVGFYQSCLIARSSSDEAFVRIWPYMLAMLAALAVVAAVPWLSAGAFR